MKKIIACFVLAALFSSLGNIGLVKAEEPPPLELPAGPEMPTMPGRLEGTGTHFALTDSQYLNITLDSSEPIKLVLESVPEMVTMHIESASGATSTQITLSGFAPETTYYKYEDDYHNLLAFTTDEVGSYTYTQDLSQTHLIFIQPRASTIYLSNSGWNPSSVGTWDSVTKTGTLTQDVAETIQIDSDNITLDGNGHTVTGTGTGNGVYLNGRTGVTVKNLTVKQFTFGIYLCYSSNNTLTGDTALNNSNGIRLDFSNNNTLTGNTALNNFSDGIPLCYSNNNTLTGNIANSNIGCGILLYSSSNNTLTGNTANSSIYWYGICLNYSTGNTLTGNTALNNFYDGIYLHYSNNNTLTGDTALNNPDGICLYCSSNNTLTGNTAKSNSDCGIRLDSSSNNTLTGNTASNNSYGIYLYYSSNNTLTNNTANSNNSYGINLLYSSSNTLTGNTASNNKFGIYLSYCSNNNTLTGNTASNNSNGILLYYSSSNKIYNNNFISNSKQAQDDYGSGNIFNLAKPLGGNYWSDWTTPDNDHDGFVDNPYVFTGGQDNLPWTRQDGWLDNIPPTTTTSLSGTLANNGWYISDVQVTLTATDNEGGSGVAKTEYSFDGTSWNTYLAPFTVSAEGTTTLYYRSADNAGNVEATNNQTINMDKTPPTITGAPTTLPNANGWYNADVVVHFTAADNVSGIDTVTPDITISTEGAGQSVTGTATDKAGNSASATVSGINIDKTPPKLTIDSPKDGKTYLNTQGPIPVNYTATDICDPHPDITMTLDGNTFNTSQIDLCGMASGEHTLVVSATDDSGNTGTASVTFRIEPQSLKAFVIKGMTINRAHDKFSIWGRFQLPEGYNLAKLKKQATVSIVISNSSGSDTVVFNEYSLKLLGIVWKYMGNEQPPGENMNITKTTVWWAPQNSKWAGWAGFYISGVLQLPQGIGVNSQAANATVAIEIPVTTEAGCGSLEGEQKITLKVNKPLYSWSYNVWPNLSAFPFDPID
jgi:parallel beta-helix repeat protein